MSICLYLLYIMTMAENGGICIWWGTAHSIIITQYCSFLTYQFFLSMIMQIEDRLLSLHTIYQHSLSSPYCYLYKSSSQRSVCIKLHFHTCNTFSESIKRRAWKSNKILFVCSLELCNVRLDVKTSKYVDIILVLCLKVKQLQVTGVLHPGTGVHHNGKQQQRQG